MNERTYEKIEDLATSYIDMFMDEFEDNIDQIGMSMFANRFGTLTYRTALDKYMPIFIEKVKEKLGLIAEDPSNHKKFDEIEQAAVNDAEEVAKDLWRWIETDAWNWFESEFSLYQKPGDEEFDLFFDMVMKGISFQLNEMRRKKHED